MEAWGEDSRARVGGMTGLEFVLVQGIGGGLFMLLCQAVIYEIGLS